MILGAFSLSLSTFSRFYIILPGLEITIKIWVSVRKTCLEQYLDFLGFHPFLGVPDIRKPSNFEPCTSVTSIANVVIFATYSSQCAVYFTVTLTCADNPAMIRVS